MLIRMVDVNALLAEGCCIGERYRMDIIGVDDATNIDLMRETAILNVNIVI